MTTVEHISVETDFAHLQACIEEDRSQFDTLCQLTPRVADAINRSRIMRELVPAQYGGRDGTMLDWFRLGQAIASIDGSAGWVAAQGAAQNLIIATQADQTFAEEYFSNPAAYPAGCIQTTVTAKRSAPGELELSGTWRFASGAAGASIVGGIITPDSPELVSTPGVPFGFVRVDQAQKASDWNPLGLRGSGSYNLTVDGVTIPESQVFSSLHPQSSRLHHRFATLGRGSYLILPSVAAVQLGIARHALDLSREVLLNKSQLPAVDAPLIHEPTVIHDLGLAEANWQLAANGMERAMADIDASLDGNEAEQQRAKIAMRACSAATAHLAATITKTAFDLAGTDSSTGGTMLERCFRDAHVLTSHISVRQRSFGSLGRLIAGVETEADRFGL